MLKEQSNSLIAVLHQETNDSTFARIKAELAELLPLTTQTYERHSLKSAPFEVTFRGRIHRSNISLFYQSIGN